VLLLPVTVLRVCRDTRCGPLCAILLVSGCTLSAADGTACVSFALIFWLLRSYIDARGALYFRWLTAALAAAIIGWILVKSWAIVSPTISTSTPERLNAARIRDIFGLKISAVVVAALVWWRIRTARTTWVSASSSVVCVALSIFIFPAAFEQSRTFASRSNGGEFADWIKAIPPTSTVLVAPAQDVGAFVWFTLQRPNYLALNQSAGVIFSRTTALEVQRRSHVLLPLMDPDWKILTSLRIAAATAGTRKVDAAVRPLTAQSLTQVCTDPELGFVVSPESVGFESLRDDHAGKWKGWNLYDCGKVRSFVRAT
jgi:hypothetical protein